MSKSLKTKVITPECVASYANVWEPRETPGGELKFSASLIFGKTADLTLLKKAAKNAVINRWGKDPKKWPKNLRSPFRDGDTDRPNDEAYQNSIFINASSKNKPGIVDSNIQPIMDQAEFYSGVVARASINFFAYDTAGNKGIGVGLNNLMKVRDGEHLGGAASAEHDFADYRQESSDGDFGADEFTDTSFDFGAGPDNGASSGSENGGNGCSKDDLFL